MPYSDRKRGRTELLPALYAEKTADLEAFGRTFAFVNPAWPHRDHFIWPHFV